MAKRHWRWLHVFLSLALAHGAGLGVKRWLEPKPLWVYPAVTDDSHTVAIAAASRDGRWLFVTHQKQEMRDRWSWTVVDRDTGHAVRPLTPGFLGDYNYGLIHSHQPVALSHDSVWWMTSVKDGNDTLLRLMCLPVRSEQPATVVKEWRFPQSLRGAFYWVDTSALHVVFQYETNLEHALHSLSALTQDGMTLLPYYMTAWTSCIYQECWQVSTGTHGFDCVKRNSSFLGRVSPSSHFECVDEAGVRYSLWDNLRADHLLTGEELGAFPLAVRDMNFGFVQQHGGLLLLRRYFRHYDPKSGYSGEFAPRGWENYPDATFEQYRVLFDKDTRRAVNWPAGMERDWMKEDELTYAVENPNEYLYSAASHAHGGSLGSRRRIDVMRRVGDQLVRQHTWEVDHASLGVAYSSEASQVYLNRVRFRHDQYPLLENWALTRPWLQSLMNYLPQHHGGLDVLAPATGKTLFTIRYAYLFRESFQYDSSSYNRKPGQLLLLRCTQANQYPLQGPALECWRTPFVIYSAWWHYGAAVLTLVMYVVAWWRWRATRCQPVVKSLSKGS